MVANSKPSAKSGKQRTKITPQQGVEILQAAVGKCREAGVNIGIKRLYNPPEEVQLILVLDGVIYQDGDFVVME